MNFIIGIFKKFLFNYLIKLINFGFAALTEYLEDMKQAKIDKKNVEKYKEDIKNPEKKSDEEIIQDGQDVLNGTNRT